MGAAGRFAVGDGDSGFGRANTRRGDAAIKKLGGGVKVDNNKAVVSVSLSDTQVTDAGVEKLRQALPKCFIYR